jgi:hypothetical protein
LTFFSGTDIATLKEEGADRNHFVSLIVNNAGTYTAAITRKIKYKAVRELSYESFGGLVELPEKETIEGEELEYFDLNIEFEGDSDDKINIIADRLKEIKAEKAKKKSVYDYKGYFPTQWTPSYSKDDKDDTLKYKPVEKKEPTLFDNNFKSFVEKKDDKKAKEPEIPVTKKLIDGIVNQLITGSVTVTTLDSEAKTKLINTITSRFDKRFGQGEEGMAQFVFWATDFIEFLLWYSVDDPDIDEAATAVDIASNTVEALEALPKSKYIDEYINILSSYVDKF